MLSIEKLVDEIQMVVLREIDFEFPKNFSIPTVVAYSTYQDVYESIFQSIWQIFFYENYVR